MNNAKAMKNVRKHRNIKLVITERRRYQNQTTKQQNFFLKFISNRNEKTQILTNKSISLGLSILELGKIVMYAFCYEYVKPKYCEKAKLCYMDTASFIVYIKTDNIYKDIAEDVETRFDSSNYE